MIDKIYKLCFASLLLVSCGPAETKEEEYLRSVFDRATIAAIYEEICLQNKNLTAKTPNLAENLAFARARYLKEIKHTQPTLTPEDLQAIPDERAAILRERMEKLLGGEKGCQSPPAEDSQALLDVLTDETPADFAGMIEENLSNVNLPPEEMEKLIAREKVAADRRKAEKQKEKTGKDAPSRASEQ